MEGLPFRADNECLDVDKGLSGGHFLNTMQNLVFNLQPDKANITKKLPKNAKYITSNIQDEFIEILADMVQDKHSSDIRKTELYTIMVDGSTDKNNEEIQGVLVRFFSSDTSQMEEKTLNIGRLGRSAKEIFEFVRKTLDESEVIFDGIVSQAYDGASVMPGAQGGLQALICSFCCRSVIYIYIYIYIH